MFKSDARILPSRILEELFFKMRYAPLKKKGIMACNANAKFIDCVLEKSFSYEERSFPKGLKRHSRK